MKQGSFHEIMEKSGSFANNVVNIAKNQNRVVEDEKSFNIIKCQKMSKYVSRFVLHISTFFDKLKIIIK